MRKLLILLFLCSASLLMAAETAEQLFEQGQSFYQQADYIHARALFEKAAKKGSVPALLSLAEMSDMMGDDKGAFGYYKRAAERGDLDGMYHLGVCYYFGRGTAKSGVEAERWLLATREALNKSPHHPYFLRTAAFLSYLYYFPHEGVPCSRPSAVRLALQSDAYEPSALVLADAYNRGIAVEEDPIRSALYAAQAEEGGRLFPRAEQAEEEVIPEVIDSTTFVFLQPDEEATFPGGQDALNSWILAHLIYPREARQINVRGVCTVSFVVEMDGSLSDLQVQETSGNTLLDAETLRMAAQMPSWTPGRYRGKIVRSRRSIRVKFG